MKHRIIYLLACALGLLALASCQSISEDNRWLPAPKSDAKEYPVLIEEYTGQKCMNCPFAAQHLRKILKQTSVPHILVAVHSPYFGSMTKGELALEEAKEFSVFFNHNRSLPGIMINRQNLGRSGFYDQERATWASLIKRIAQKEPDYTLELSASFDAEKKEILAQIKTSERVKNLSRDLNLNFWLVEDLVAPQVFQEHYDRNYQHHNVLRAMLNGVWGEPYLLGTPYSKAFKLPQRIKDVKETHLIAFLSDRKTKEIYISQIVRIDKKNN